MSISEVENILQKSMSVIFFNQTLFTPYFVYIFHIVRSNANLIRLFTLINTKYCKASTKNTLRKGGKHYAKELIKKQVIPEYSQGKDKYLSILRSLVHPTTVMLNEY